MMQKINGKNKAEAPLRTSEPQSPSVQGLSDGQDRGNAHILVPSATTTPFGSWIVRVTLSMALLGGVIISAQYLVKQWGSLLILAAETQKSSLVTSGPIEYSSTGEMLLNGQPWIETAQLQQIDEGSKEFTSNMSSVYIPFSKAKIKLSPSETGQLVWKCKKASPDEMIKVEENGHQLRLDLLNLSQAECEISLPLAKAQIEGQFGHVSVMHPHTETSVQLKQGHVSIDQDFQKNYRFDLKTGLGEVETFDSSMEPLAIPIQVFIESGKIQHLDKVASVPEFRTDEMDSADMSGGNLSPSSEGNSAADAGGAQEKALSEPQGEEL